MGVVKLVTLCAVLSSVTGQEDLLQPRSGSKTANWRKGKNEACLLLNLVPRWAHARESGNEASLSLYMYIG